MLGQCGEFGCSGDLISPHGLNIAHPTGCNPIVLFCKATNILSLRDKVRGEVESQGGEECEFECESESGDQGEWRSG